MSSLLSLKRKSDPIFSEFLKDLRFKSQLTISVVAVALGVSESTVSRWENGTIPKYQNLEKISELYGVDMGEIVFRANSQKGFSP